MLRLVDSVTIKGLIHEPDLWLYDAGRLAALGENVI
jgi:hypothetical protein